LYLVGYHGGRLAELSRRPGVIATGEVDEMTPWLRRSQVCAVPIRAGSGTRTKILEAVAHGVPVVSSHIGIEGLHLVDGTHAFVTDDPARFVDCCVRLLEDAALRGSMAKAAQGVLSARYRLESAREQIMDTVSAALLGTAGPPRPERS
jgi:glycosyltransferase involved in cell wall biosynthesis